MTLGPIEAARVFTFAFARAYAFYTDTLALTPLAKGDGFAMFDTGACKLILETADPDDPEGQALVGRFAGLSFTVPDVAACHRTLSAKGVAFDGPPEPQPWGGILAHFKDPDGNVLTLVQYPSVA